MARVIDEVRPEWVFCENVEGHITLGFPEVGSELRAMGYRVKAGLFSAYELGAGQQRRRLFVLAHADRSDERQPGGVRPGQPGAVLPAGQGCEGNAGWPQRGRARLDALLAAGPGRWLQRRGGAGDIPLFAPSPCAIEAWQQVLRRRADLQPAVFGLADGLATRMERRRTAGNGVAPLAAAFAYSTLKEDFNGH